MIPKDYITEWRERAPWAQDAQVEQDLVICRALVELFGDEELGSKMAFRGGTALYKLHITPAARYSEDIDLVQVGAEPIGATLDRIRVLLDPWLGTPHRDQSEGRVTLRYRFQSEDQPPQTLRLKVEINSREHFTVFGIHRVPFSVHSRWFSGEALIPTYDIDELLGTKMRALYQRRKGRDLFDLALALETPAVNPQRVVEAFTKYLEAEGGKITRAMFERNLADKLLRPEFLADLSPLLAPGREWTPEASGEKVMQELIGLIGGDVARP